MDNFFFLTITGGESRSLNLPTILLNDLETLVIHTKGVYDRTVNEINPL
jgi:hypothetical protein